MLKLILQGKLVEAAAAVAGAPDLPEGSAWRVRIIRAGLSENGNDYPLSVLHEAAHLFEGAKILSRSDQAHVHNEDTDAPRVVGWIQDVQPVADGLEGTAVFHGGSSRSRDIRESMTASWKLGKQDLFGLSIVADGVAAKSVKLRGGRPVRTVEKILAVHSVDVVVNPAAGGRFLQLVAGVNPGRDKDGDLVNLEKLLKLIEAHDPVAYKALDKDNLDPDKVVELAAKIVEAKTAEAKRLAEAAAKPQDPKPAAKVDPSPDLAALTEAVGALRGEIATMREAQSKDASAKVLEELAAMKFAAMFDEMFAEADLPDEAKDHILARLSKSDRTVDGRAKLAEAIKAEQTYLNRQEFRGVPSAFAESDVFVGADAGEKYLAALTGALTGRDEPWSAKDPKDTVPRFRSIREAYIVGTGDVKLTGRMPKRPNGLVFGLYEAAQAMNAQWGYALGDSITRAMMREYAEYPLQQWRQIVNTNMVNDFRTQHRTQVGGFPTLSTVTAGSSYVGFTDVPDDFEVTYAVSKKGNTQEITLEMITNDDVKAVARVPKMIARAALRTLSNAVWTPITANSTLTDPDDLTALFTVAHGNTTASFEAMSLDSVVKGRTMMMKQTAKAGVDGTAGERLMIGPKYLWGAVDLEQLMFELIMATGQPLLDLSTPSASESQTRPNFLKRLNLTPIVVPHITDTNDWGLIADPNMAPTIEVGFLGGREEPELFVQDMPNVGSMFTADKLTYKIRHIYGVVVEDYRQFYAQLD